MELIMQMSNIDSVFEMFADCNFMGHALEV